MSNASTPTVPSPRCTIRKADWIIELRHAEIVERGTHSELLKLNGLYARISRIQNTFIEEGFEKLSVVE
jgi:ABC-type transport system involved in cytochrome bd biosynthesis fused ATPase/permease subunit